MPKVINVKDKLSDNTLDLSCSELKDVPVKEISFLKKATILQLSNNELTFLPHNFIILTQIIKLDLSKNNLTNLPENFGELIQLKHLDLYSNQLTNLPISFGKLKNLKWLDLKNNPLISGVASVAGPCNTNAECLNCAKNVVMYFSDLAQALDKALRSLDDNEPIATVPKKEPQKKKKKSEKEKNVDSLTKINKQTVEKNNAKTNKTKSKNKSSKVKKGGLIRSLCSAFSWLLLIFFITIILIPFLPNAKEILDYAKEKTGLPIQPYKIDVQIPPAVKEKAQLFMNYTYNFIDNIYHKYFAESSVIINKEI